MFDSLLVLMITSMGAMSTCISTCLTIGIRSSIQLGHIQHVHDNIQGHMLLRLLRHLLVHLISELLNIDRRWAHHLQLVLLKEDSNNKMVTEKICMDIWADIHQLTTIHMVTVHTDLMVHIQCISHLTQCINSLIQCISSLIPCISSLIQCIISLIQCISSLTVTILTSGNTSRIVWAIIIHTDNKTITLSSMDVVPTSNMTSIKQLTATTLTSSINSTIQQMLITTKKMVTVTMVQKDSNTQMRNIMTT